MCATNDPATLQRLRRRKKPIRAWKVLLRSGRNFVVPGIRAQYGPGQVKAKSVTRVTLYDSSMPRGLHVYSTKRVAQWWAVHGCIVVPVHVNSEDLIAAELPDDGVYCSQLVACRLTIRPEDWAAAGLPKRATRRRYV